QARVDRDLETVCLKCLDKEPSRRYRSAEALAEDLERWLNGEPITARPTRRLERAVRWARRHPTAAALIVVSALAALSLAAWGLLYLDQRARLAEHRVEVHSLIGQGQEAAGKGHWQEAQRAVASARTLIGSHASLADLQGAVEQLGARVDAED